MLDRVNQRRMQPAAGGLPDVQLGADGGGRALIAAISGEEGEEVNSSTVKFKLEILREVCHLAHEKQEMVK